MPKPLLPAVRRRIAALGSDEGGAVLIETALSLPILVFFLIGILTYGTWFMVAHIVQQAANEGARAAIAGVDDTDRATLVNQSVTRSLAGGGTIVNPALAVTATQTSADGYYTVTITYNARQSPLFSSPLVPLPSGQIRRGSVVKLSAI